MAVIVNEFEVVAEPTAPQPANPAAEPAPASPDPELLEWRQLRRAMRVRAY
jgi:hypothetical protein